MTTICLSGGFDPLHCGHIDMIIDAKKYGNIVIVLNSDEWLIRKKGYYFMPWKDRYKILMMTKHIYHVTHVDDSDDTICEALWRIKPDFFANGGDRTKANPSEDKVCKELNITQLFGIGGGKITSSSELVRRVAQYVK